MFARLVLTCTVPRSGVAGIDATAAATVLPEQQMAKTK